jgi:hypothetical protein
MTHRYSLTIVNDEGEVIISRLLAADDAVAVLGSVLDTVTDGTAEVEQEQANDHQEIEIEPARPITKKKKGKNKCSLCGNAGHTRRKCPSNDEYSSAEDERGAPHTAVRSKSDEPLTPPQFGDVKEGIKHGLDSMDLAAQIGMIEAEVNRAIKADNYAEYLEARDAVTG